MKIKYTLLTLGALMSSSSAVTTFSSPTIDGTATVATWTITESVNGHSGQLTATSSVVGLFNTATASTNPLATNAQIDTDQTPKTITWEYIGTGTMSDIRGRVRRLTGATFTSSTGTIISSDQPAATGATIAANYFDTAVGSPAGNFELGDSIQGLTISSNDDIANFLTYDASNGEVSTFVTDGGNTSGLAFRFDLIPEPSTGLLVVLSGLALVARRKR